MSTDVSPPSLFSLLLSLLPQLHIALVPSCYFPFNVAGDVGASVKGAYYGIFPCSWDSFFLSSRFYIFFSGVSHFCTLLGDWSIGLFLWTFILFLHAGR